MTEIEELRQRVMKLEAEVKALIAKVARLRPPKNSKTEPPEHYDCANPLCNGHGISMATGEPVYLSCRPKHEEVRRAFLMYRAKKLPKLRGFKPREE